jgi:hypothetical protein
MAISGELKVSKFRSVCWNILVGGLSNSPETWITQRNQQREEYHEIKLKHILNPHAVQMAEEKDNSRHRIKESHQARCRANESQR